MKIRFDDDKRRTISIVLFCISAVCITIMIVHSVRKKSEYEKGNAIYAGVRDNAILYEVNLNNSISASENDVNVSSDPRSGWLYDADGQNAYYMHIESEKLASLNPQYTAWIYGCGGEINYPIVQSEPDDEKFYLKHDFYGNYDVLGCLYVKPLTEPFIQSDTTIYGHNMRTGDSMFHCLVNYKEESYFLQYPTIYIFTDEGDRKYEIFSAYNMTVVDLNYYQNLAQNKTKAEYLEELKARSLYDTGVEVSEDDVILTLVACEYSEWDSRMIIHARCVEP